MLDTFLISHSLVYTPGRFIYKMVLLISQGHDFFPIKQDRGYETHMYSMFLDYLYSLNYLLLVNITAYWDGILLAAY